MNPTDLASSALSVFSVRFLLVVLLPVTAGALYLLCLVWSGAPKGHPEFSGISRSVDGSGVGTVVLLVVAVLVVAVLLQAALPGAHRLWQGTAWFPMRSARRRAHLGTKQGFDRTERDASAQVLVLPPDQRQAVADVAFHAARHRDLAYPPRDADVRATALGNALLALWTRAGQEHGWRCDVAWPRLYAVLPDRARLLVEDARNSLDQAVALATVSVLASLAGLPLLAPARWWTLLTLLPLTLAVLSYRSAVDAVPALRAAVQNAFDLHRFDLLQALHLPLPADTAAEHLLAGRLCDAWRRDAPFRTPFHHAP
ncbi:hypothetical protein [Streptomyces sp. CB03911]|uniref:hypothetical protein n=1 Tax=Streptomyces sp. CB03911 TaxID=1804758 RepID=UPI00093B6689|nr:hypothetical protein [Streptomyces sp. CB03911]OKI25050.1 hypothetical protein A6A07_31105 [Streptomyces sp. CB03911]